MQKIKAKAVTEASSVSSNVDQENEVVESASVSVKEPKYEVLCDIKIFCPAKKAMVDAKIVQFSIGLFEQKMENVWWAEKKWPARAKKEPDRDWNWYMIVAAYSNNALSCCVAVLSEEGGVEGVMAYDLKPDSLLEPGKRALHIERIAVAPRNRKWLKDPPSYQGVGTAFIDWAIRESYEAALDGRVILTSVKSERTRAFYKLRGFVQVGAPATTSQGGIYELPKEVAIASLTEKGAL